MKAKGLFAVVLVCVLLLAGCKNASGSEAVSSGTSDAASSGGTTSVSIDPGNPIEVTPDLRAKYFDYFLQNSTELLPRFDFNSVSDISETNLVYYATRNVQPINVSDSEDFDQMSTYAGADLRAAFLKYFNLSNVDLLKTSYTYNEQKDYLYLTRQMDTLAYRFVMLTDLSQNSEGIYTASFTVFNKYVATKDEAAAVTADYRKSLITGESNYSVYGTCKMSFKEIPDGDSFYIQFLSSVTDETES